MWYWLGVGNEKESFFRLLKFVKNPVVFFKGCKDNENTLLSVMTLIIRASILIEGLIEVITNQFSLGPQILLISVLILAKLIAKVSLVIGSVITNFFVKLITQKDNILAAKRIVAYTCVYILIPKLPYTETLITLLVIVLHTIGISKQYSLSWFKSLICALAFRFILIILVALIWMLINLNQFISSSSYFPLF